MAGCNLKLSVQFVRKCGFIYLAPVLLEQSLQRPKRHVLGEDDPLPKHIQGRIVVADSYQREELVIHRRKFLGNFERIVASKELYIFSSLDSKQHRWHR
jgi:hypothetical protein